MANWHSTENPPDNQRTVIMYQGAGGYASGFWAFGSWKYTAGHKVVGKILGWHEMPEWEELDE